MKILLTLIIILATAIISLANASDLSSQLEDLKRQGYVIRMGELTGAGGKLSRVQGFIHPEMIIKKSACTSISVRSSVDQQNLKVSDVTKINIGENVVSAQELIGYYSIE
jgi:hypothetical protein